MRLSRVQYTIVVFISFRGGGVMLANEEGDFFSIGGRIILAPDWLLGL